MSDFSYEPPHIEMSGVRESEVDPQDRGDGGAATLLELNHELSCKGEEGREAEGGVLHHSLEDFKCPICLDTFINTVKVDCPYGHKFCNFCIQSWINYERNMFTECPVCRSPIFGKHLDLKTDAQIRSVLESLSDQDKHNRLLSISERLQLEYPGDAVPVNLESIRLSDPPHHPFNHDLSRPIPLPTDPNATAAPSFPAVFLPSNVDEHSHHQHSEYHDTEEPTGANQPQQFPFPLPGDPPFEALHYHQYLHQSGGSSHTSWDPFMSPIHYQTGSQAGSDNYHDDILHSMDRHHARTYFHNSASSYFSSPVSRYSTSPGYVHVPTSSPPGYFCCCSPACQTHHCNQPPSTWHPPPVSGRNYHVPPIGSFRPATSFENTTSGSPRTRPNMPGSMATTIQQPPSPTTVGRPSSWSQGGVHGPRPTTPVVAQSRHRQPVLRCPLRSDNAQFSGGFPVFSSGHIGFQIFHAPTTVMLGDRMMTSSPSLLTHPLVSIHPLNSDGSSTRVYLTFEVHKT